MLALLLAVLCTHCVVGLDNGLGLVPPMGYCSWNDQSSEVNEVTMKQRATQFMELGLTRLGYVHFNVDEGWLKGRDANGTMMSDPSKFPSGMKALGDWLHARGLKYGLYTSRGDVQCGTKHYHGVPGTEGHVTQDAHYMVAAGIDYLKEDSCGGSQVHTTAFKEYESMRDALNKTGRPVYFSLCGWHSWYAPAGKPIANSWRISGDGHDYEALMMATNVVSTITEYNGPGGWNDPDLLIGTGQGSPSNNGHNDGWNWGQTDLQSRTQFSLWSVFPAPLLLSANPYEVTDYAFETWSNAEVIAVNQDPLGSAGIRLMGGNMTFGEEESGGSWNGKGVNVWGRKLSTGTFAFVFVNNEGTTQDITCDMKCLAPLNMHSTEFSARDLWSHTTFNTTFKGSFTAKQVPAMGGCAMFTFNPLH